MLSEERNAATQSTAKRILGQIRHCLRSGCVICIEHAPTIAPRFTPWAVWGRRYCYDGDMQGIYTEIDRCRAKHTDHHIRLNIEDYSCYSRFSFMVHSPAAAG